MLDGNYICLSQMSGYIVTALFVSFLWGLMPVVHKHLLDKFNQITVMVLQSVIYCALIVILGFARKDEILEDVKKMSVRDAAIFFLVTLFCAFFANIIYFYLLKNHESSIISALIYSSPVFTLIIAYLFLKERLDIYGLSGIFAMILGVILISQNNSSSRHLEFLTSE